MSDVINLFGSKKGEEKKKEKKSDLQADSSKQGLSFAEIAARNAANRKRIEEERKQKNKNVLKSYRLK